MACSGSLTAGVVGALRYADCSLDVAARPLHRARPRAATRRWLRTSRFPALRSFAVTLSRSSRRKRRTRRRTLGSRSESCARLLEHGSAPELPARYTSAWPWCTLGSSPRRTAPREHDVEQLRRCSSSLAVHVSALKRPGRDHLVRRAPHYARRLAMSRMESPRRPRRSGSSRRWALEVRRATALRTRVVERAPPPRAPRARPEHRPQSRALRLCASDSHTIALDNTRRLAQGSRAGRLVSANSVVEHAPLRRAWPSRSRFRAEHSRTAGDPPRRRASTCHSDGSELR